MKAFEHNFMKLTSIFMFIFISNYSAAVSFVADVYRLGGVGLGSGLTGKPGRAWVGAWVVLKKLNYQKHNGTSEVSEINIKISNSDFIQS